MARRFTRADAEKILKLSPKELEQRLLKRYDGYIQSLEPTTAEVKIYRAARVKAKAMRDKLIVLFNDKEPKLRKKICVDWDYCEVRKKVPVDLIVHVALLVFEQGIGSSEFGPNSSLEVATYTIQLDLLAVYCSCDKRPPTGSYANRRSAV